MQKFDALIIGSGRNGLITGCCLAKAGYKVGILEKRDTVGLYIFERSKFFSERMKITSKMNNK